MTSIQALLTQRISLIEESRTRTITSVCTSLLCSHLIPALTHFKSLSRHLSYTLSLRNFRSYFSIEAASQNVQSIFNACKASFFPVIDYSNFAITLNDIPNVTILTQKLKKMAISLPTIKTIVDACKAIHEPFNLADAILAMLQHPYTQCAAVAAICDSVVSALLPIKNPIYKDIIRTPISGIVLTSLAHGYGVDVDTPLMVYAGYRAIYHLMECIAAYKVRKKFFQLCDEIMRPKETTAPLSLKTVRKNGVLVTTLNVETAR